MRVEYIIIFVVCLVIAIAITRSQKKDFKLEANKLVMLLGGKDNVIDYQVNKSRFIVNLKDVSKANKEGIQRMGAQGIVEIDNQLKIILGSDAKQLIKYINELKWYFVTFFHISTKFDKIILYNYFGDIYEYIWGSIIKCCIIAFSTFNLFNIFKF